MMTGEGGGGGAETQVIQSTEEGDEQCDRGCLLLHTPLASTHTFILASHPTSLLLIVTQGGGMGGGGVD